MKKVFSQLLLITLFSTSFAVWNFAQEKPAPTPPVEEDTDVVKISTALIQLDVVVTDKSGKLVTDLKPEDFEILENGERQTVTNATYLAAQKNQAGDANLNVLNGTNRTMPTIGEVRRTVGIVVDDAGLSAQSINLVKKQLVKFIRDQVQQGDLVAIIKTSGSVGISQQFTTDKRKLLATIENLHYQPLTGGGLSSFEPIGITFAEQIAANSGSGELTKEAIAVSEQKNNLESLAELNRNLTVTTGSLGVLNTTIAAMSNLPGRKSVLYASDGLASLFDVDFASNSNRADPRNSANLLFADTDKLREKLRGITELANRATIAIYTLDTRGALPINFSADTYVAGGMTDRENGGRNNTALNAASNEIRASQQGLKFLAEETSGKAFINTNDLGKSLQETLDSQNGYYILAYQPNSETFDAEKRRFNKLTIKVKRPNMEVVYRSGFFNVAEKSPDKKSETPNNVFLQKVFSPYRYTDVNLRMASVYTVDEKASTVRAFVNVNAKDLQFIEGADGNKTARFDIIAVTFNENGIPIAEVGKIFEVKVSPKRYKQLLVQGIAYNLTFTTRMRGSQQIKVAVRDQNTQKIGTASQIIFVPNLDKDTIGSSGILLQNYSMQEWQNLQSGKPPTDAATRMQADTARRQFRKGTVLSFNYAVYAAPSLNTKSQAQFTVFKDGKEIFKGAPEDLIIASNGKMQRVNKGGAFMLGTDMAAGKYILQVSVAGDALKEAEIQQIDFELMN